MIGGENRATRCKSLAGAIASDQGVHRCDFSHCPVGATEDMAADLAEVRDGPLERA